MTVCLLLTWSKLPETIGQERLEGVSFRPKCFLTKDAYLCDSYVEADVTVHNIVGLAFVLHEEQPVLRQMEGTQHV